MKLGVFIALREGTDIDAEFQKLRDNAFTNCQLNIWDDKFKTAEIAKAVDAARNKYQIEITAFWCGWGRPIRWNFYEGPHTLGLVPAAYRANRIENLKRGSDFAQMLGIQNMITHMGFLPEVPTSTEFHQVVCAIREVADYCRERGQNLLFETGQETPVTLLRTIEAVGTDNLGVNLDAANLVLYGKGNPVDALDVFGTYVMGVHAKDGFYPTNGRELGKEVPIGQGVVNFPALISKLKACGYDGPLTIEREIQGEEQLRDILAARAYLEPLL